MPMRPEVIATSHPPEVVRCSVVRRGSVVAKWVGGDRCTKIQKYDMRIINIVPLAEEAYWPVINDPVAFRRWIDDGFQESPELFPANFAFPLRRQALPPALQRLRLAVKQRAHFLPLAASRRRWRFSAGFLGKKAG
jgi:hypothetical protein